MAKTDAPMDKTMEQGFSTVPAPKIKTSKPGAVPQAAQSVPLGARKPWAKNRPHTGISPESKLTREKVTVPVTGPAVHQGAGFDDPTGVKAPSANLDGLTKKTKL